MIYSAEVGAKIYGAEVGHVGCQRGAGVDLVCSARRHGPRRRDVKSRRRGLWRRPLGFRNGKRFPRGLFVKFFRAKGQKTKKAEWWLHSPTTKMIRRSLQGLNNFNFFKGTFVRMFV